MFLQKLYKNIYIKICFYKNFITLIKEIFKISISTVVTYGLKYGVELEVSVGLVELFIVMNANAD